MLSESQVIAVFGALAQETRLRIVRALVTAGNDGVSAGTMAEAIGVSPSNLSFHLKELERAGLVTSRREQRSIIYVCCYDTLANMQAFLMANCCAGLPDRGSTKSAPAKALQAKPRSKQKTAAGKGRRSS